MMRTSFR